MSGEKKIILTDEMNANVKKILRLGLNDMDRYVLAMIEDMEERLQEDNEPLEIEQLMKMDGEPVYIIAKPDADGEQLKFWALVEVGRFHSDDLFLTNAAGGRSEIGEVIKDIEAIYRRPPERATP